MEKSLKSQGIKHPRTKAFLLICNKEKIITRFRWYAYIFAYGQGQFTETEMDRVDEFFEYVEENSGSNIVFF